jgi:hypothetical protein
LQAEAEKIATKHFDASPIIVSAWSFCAFQAVTVLGAPVAGAAAVGASVLGAALGAKVLGAAVVGASVFGATVVGAPQSKPATYVALSGVRSEAEARAEAYEVCTPLFANQFSTNVPQVPKVRKFPPVWSEYQLLDAR